MQQKRSEHLKRHVIEESVLPERLSGNNFFHRSSDYSLQKTYAADCLHFKISITDSHRDAVATLPKSLSFN